MPRCKATILLFTIISSSHWLSGYGAQPVDCERMAAILNFFFSHGTLKKIWWHTNNKSNKSLCMDIPSSDTLHECSRYNKVPRRSD